MTTDTKRLRELANMPVLYNHEPGELRSLILAACEELERIGDLERAYKRAVEKSDGYEKDIQVLAKSFDHNADALASLRAENEKLRIAAPPPSDLTRAQELLREWREAAIAVENIVASAELSWHAVDQSWTVNLSYQNWKDEDSDPEQPFAVDPSPLAAVRAAIAMTPWNVE